MLVVDADLADELGRSRAACYRSKTASLACFPATSLLIGAGVKAFDKIREERDEVHRHL